MATQTNVIKEIMTTNPHITMLASTYEVLPYYIQTKRYKFINNRTSFSTVYSSNVFYEEITNMYLTHCNNIKNIKLYISSDKFDDTTPISTIFESPSSHIVYDLSIDSLKIINKLDKNKNMENTLTLPNNFYLDPHTLNKYGSKFFIFIEPVEEENLLSEIIVKHKIHNKKVTIFLFSKYFDYDKMCRSAIVERHMTTRMTITTPCIASYKKMGSFGTIFITTDKLDTKLNILFYMKSSHHKFNAFVKLLHIDDDPEYTTDDTIDKDVYIYSCDRFRFSQKNGVSLDDTSEIIFSSDIPTTVNIEITYTFSDAIYYDEYLKFGAVM